MAEGFSGIIAQLERQKAVIERALEALREISGVTGSVPVSVSPSPRVRRGRPPGSSNKRSAGQKRRWAAKRAVETAVAEIPEKAAPRKHITPEGRQKLAEAMKKRWAVKRAGTAVKKTARKKRAAKKTA